MLGATFVVWAVGATAAPVVAILANHAGNDAWRWMLASPVVFALVTLFLRLGTPESPRWLVNQGRVEEADASIKKVFGDEYGVEHLGEVEPETRATLSTGFRPPYLRRTLFVGLFWMCQVIPLLSIYSFSFDFIAEADLVDDARFGFRVIRAGDLDVLGIDGAVDIVRQRVGDTPVYVSIDIDVLDPAFAPGTGTPEMGGFNSRELLHLLRRLDGLNIVGGDVVEVDPAYDHAEITCMPAATVAFDLITLMTKTQTAVS